MSVEVGDNLDTLLRRYMAHTTPAGIARAEAKAQLTSLINQIVSKELEGIKNDPTIPPDCPGDCKIKDPNMPLQEHWHHVTIAALNARLEFYRGKEKEGK